MARRDANPSKQIGQKSQQRLQPHVYQPACKPGSVWAALTCRPRRPFIWDACCHAPQAINPGGGPEDGLDIVRFLPHVRPPLFDLAPGGVCPATSVTRRAVRSYRTFSPLLAFPLRVTSQQSLAGLPRRSCIRCEGGRFVFCGTFPGVAPGGR